MDLEEFDFKLPKELIAQHPAHPRDHARLLVYRRADGSIEDDFFYNLPQYLDPDTTLVINNSKVEKARLRFDVLEVFIVESHDDVRVTAMVRPGKKFKLGATLKLTDDIEASVEHINSEGLRRLRFNLPLSSAAFDPYRLTPLPPYIKQDESLADEYQTVYARELGSKAAPTAGLHFTDQLLDEVKQQWPIAELTLHVGLGTFAPIEQADIERKKLHAEMVSLDERNADILNKARHLTAVGTTSVRSLESLIDANGMFHESSKATELFIQPGATLRAVDSLITNFHLPKSSLLMLVAALTGKDELMKIYDHAIRNAYRFYSFGDAMIIV